MFLLSISGMTLNANHPVVFSEGSGLTFLKGFLTRTMKEIFLFDPYHLSWNVLASSEFQACLLLRGCKTWGRLVNSRVSTRELESLSHLDYYVDCD